MKTFKITYVRHGTYEDYPEEERVTAVSSKMALKKFFNYRTPGDKKTRKQWWAYDRWANGITYSEPVVTEVEE